jgi:hypothetical protein
MRRRLIPMHNPVLKEALKRGQAKTYTPSKYIPQILSSPKRDYHGTLPEETMRELCSLRFEVIKSIERIFELNPNTEDATFLVNSLTRWKEGNFGRYVEGESFTPEEIEAKIKRYYEHVSPKKISA